jgi:hypothetical protein
MEPKPETLEPGLDEFRPTEGGGDSADPGLLVVVAYLLFWLLIASFIALTWRKVRGIEGRLARLERGSGAREEPRD